MRFKNHILDFIAFRLPGNQHGMTLIDMCVFLMVIGLLTLPMVKAYENYVRSYEINFSIGQTSAISKAIDDFYYENDRYPCPANITLPTTNPNYGVEACPVGAPVPGNVLNGMVPFVSLKIPDTKVRDAWNQRIRYAVTDTMRVAPMSLNANAGDIVIMSLDNPAFPPNPPPCLLAPVPFTTDGQYVLVSNGPSGVGARGANGQLIQNCNAGTRDGENCDEDNTFIDRTCAPSDRAGATFYDDLIRIATNPPTRIWVNTTDDPANDIITFMPKIGINTDDNGPFPNPWDPNGLDVVGNVKAERDPALPPDPNNPGAIRSATMADPNGLVFFNPSNIAGNDPNMNCSSVVHAGKQTGMRGIQTRSAVCKDEYLPAAASSCPPPGQPNNTLVIGFIAGGTVLCGPPPP
ncbi:MAG: hypothetical protein IT558_00820 [Alphaproteobacteria bacterium]|nr:hypothetical protein [Alphaproteobacteria bacterium]